MRKLAGVIVAALAFALVIVLAGCSSGTSSSAASSTSASGSTASASAASSAASTASASASSSTLADGQYTVDVTTDSTMFHINEADNGTGVLTVKDGAMTVHIRLASKKIVNLYAGTSEEAKSDSDNVIQPTTDTVTYADGAQKEVYGFDVPVPGLDEEFSVAILGEKGNWYDHKVSVANPVAQ